MNNNSYPGPLENLAAMLICVGIGVALTKVHQWSIEKAKKEQVVGG